MRPSAPLVVIAGALLQPTGRASDRRAGWFERRVREPVDPERFVGAIQEIGRDWLVLNEPDGH